jgi:hypothetical protein
MRAEPYADANRHSRAVAGNRVTNRPVNLRALIRWATREWSAEVPSRLHDRDIADDGAPDFTPEAKRVLGMTGTGNQPDDWQRIACRLDSDGYRATPLHCVVAGFPDEQRRYLRDLLTNLYTPDAIAELHGIPRAFHEAVARDLLTICWNRYSATPMPRRSVGWVDKSEAQRAAEEAA